MTGPAEPWSAYQTGTVRNNQCDGAYRTRFVQVTQGGGCISACNILLLMN